MIDSRKLQPESLAPVVDSGPTALFATISGAHLYGFPSADSDVDIRGAYVRPLDEVLGLGPHRDTWEVSEVRDGLEVDWVAHDVIKFVHLMTKRNGYVLEQLYSPLVVRGGQWIHELRALGRGCVIRPLYFHYRGFFHNQRKLMAKSQPTAKAVLYAYRVLLTGIHVLSSSRIEANLKKLLAEYPQSGVQELIDMKVEGGEKDVLEPSLLATHQAALEKLEEGLDQAYQESKLPAEVGNREALSNFVIKARKTLGV